MKVSPESIKKQEFNTSFRGYDKEEVRAYMERFADDLDELQKENEQLKNELEQSNALLEEFRKIEKDFQETMLKAQESASKTLELSRSQSDALIKESETRAAQIIEKAKKQAKEINDAVLVLKEEKNLIVAKLKAIVNSQANLLEMKIEEPGEKESGEKILEPSRKLEIDVNEIADKLKNSK
ncbi:MAG TPA: DivIVA domain-containing protein [Ignavibacteriaceae bacterium]|nr:DivIVA domain-containing protein [Ignavibacteriaceae bacterium]